MAKSSKFRPWGNNHPSCGMKRRRSAPSGRRPLSRTAGRSRRPAPCAISRERGIRQAAVRHMIRACGESWERSDNSAGVGSALMFRKLLSFRDRDECVSSCKAFAAFARRVRADYPPCGRLPVRRRLSAAKQQSVAGPETVPAQFNRLLATASSQFYCSWRAIFTELNSRSFLDHHRGGKVPIGQAAVKWPDADIGS